MQSLEKRKILVIEDENHLAEGLRLNLELQNYEVKVASDGISGLMTWQEWKPELIILDLMLPGLDGLSVLKRMRSIDANIPVLILSAKNKNYDRVKGLRMGSDDYLSKPFDLNELLLRVEKLFLRCTVDDKNQLVQKNYQFGENTINFQNAKAHTQLGEIQLTDQELKILKILIQNSGIAVSRDQLLSVGWGYKRGTNSRTVDNFVMRLRKYFEPDPKTPIYFKSIRSHGYLFSEVK
ncbi:MAG: response regulator transcription factor [Bacteriovoracaceae bacterium]|jgi:two-component system, OmpR family, alkaline phosphatase synthesis response regulator PhoP|nr:response regulator transcription factor [Bacteriovoracaceae bacterium]